jgi:hypothetical protein
MRTTCIAPLILVSALLVSGCNHDAPTAPSPPPAPPPPIPVTSMWNIAVRLVAVAGGECVGETMQSQLGMPKSYSLSTTSKGNMVDVTLKSATGDYACTFPAKAESDGFTTFGVGGFLSCETTTAVIRNFACANGTLRDMQRFGEDISGHISGEEITGQWNVSWIVMKAGGDHQGADDIAELQTMAQYTGNR